MAHGSWLMAHGSWLMDTHDCTLLIRDETSPPRSFLLLFGYFMTAFSAAMFILYPRSGEGIITTIPAFNTWYSALYAQLGVALVGNPTTLYTDPALLEPLGPWEMVDMMVSAP